MGKILKLKGLHLVSSVLGVITDVFHYVYNSPKVSGPASTGAVNNIWSYNNSGVLGALVNFARVQVGAYSSGVTFNVNVGKLDVSTGIISTLASKAIDAEDVTRGYIDFDFQDVTLDAGNILVVGSSFSNPTAAAINTPIRFGAKADEVCHYWDDNSEIVYSGYAVSYDYGIKD